MLKYVHGYVKERHVLDENNCWKWERQRFGEGDILGDSECD